MFEGIMMAIAIFVGIPVGAMLVYIAIERYYDRQIVRESRVSDPYDKVKA